MVIIEPGNNEGRSCIVPSTSPGYSVPSESKPIPVDQKVRRLFILHATAWGSGNAVGAEVMKYIINYNDGHVETVAALNNIHIGDWYYPSELPHAKVGIIRTNDQLRDVGIGLMTWIHPRPDSSVSHIEVQAEGRGLRMVVALTAEVLNK